MPRYYCDYCDTYLTHDSPSVRKQHNAGYKHKANVRSYYQQFEEQQTQSLIDQRIKEHLGQAAAFQQVGAAYSQHLASLPGNPPRPRLPILPTPLMPPSGMAPSLLPGIRLPVLPRPPPGAPVYGSAPSMMPNVAPPGAPTMPMQGNGMARPPTYNLPTAATTGAGTLSSNGAPSAAMQTVYQASPSAPGSTVPTSSASAEGFAYAQASDAAQ